MAIEKQHISIKEWATEDKPREKLLEKGGKALTNAELLAILINTGTRNRSALDIAKEILTLAGQDLLGFEQMDYHQLKEVRGLGPKKAVTLLAAIELGRRGKLAVALNRKSIATSRDAFEVLIPFYSDLSREHCYAVFLDQTNRLLSVVSISTGGLTATVVDPRIIFRKALEIKNTAQIIISHNHPSGSVNPSRADRNITKKLIEGAKLLDLKCVDHIIIGHNDYFSFADAAIMI